MSVRRLPTPRSLPWLRRLLRLFFEFFYAFRATGQEHLPRAGAVLIAANHQSYLDPLLVAVGQERPLSFMTWGALFHVRGLGWLIRKFAAFPVELENPDPSGYRMALRCLRAGQGVVIFPEGGRTEDGRLMPLREGVARLALHTGAPIVPVRIEGAYDAWPKSRLLPGIFKPVTVTYGPPIAPPRGVHRNAERDQAVSAIMEKIRDFLEKK